MLKKYWVTILTAILLIPFGFLLAFMVHDTYEEFAEDLFRFFNNGLTKFVGGHDFGIFPSFRKLASTGTFTSLSFLLVRFSLRSNRVKRICFSFIIFLFTVVFLIALDSLRFSIESITWYNRYSGHPPYDMYFIISLSTSLTYLLIAYFLEQRQISK